MKKRTQQTPYVSYFQREAENFQKNNSVKFVDFFNGCKSAIGRYKEHIENEYNKRLTENNWTLNSYYQALKRGLTIDQKGEPIQSHIDWIENDKKFVKEQGYENNRDYCCTIKETGEITESVYDMKYTLYYSDIADLELAITQAKKESDTKKSSINKVQQGFSDYLHHENKIALLVKLHELIAGNKGREVAKIIMALEDKRYLIIPTKGMKKMLNSMELEFGNIGSSQSVNNYYRKNSLMGI